GAQLPRNNDPEQADFYCASMMLLLQPWRNLTDLKAPGATWKDAFAIFLSTATEAQKRFLAGVQYFHECQ
ncbi:hypothetical protein K523DRAFT_222467, partial [Schizophyllum commune Tattone D]